MPDPFDTIPDDQRTFDDPPPMHLMPDAVQARNAALQAFAARQWLFTRLAVYCADGVFVRVWTTDGYLRKCTIRDVNASYLAVIHDADGEIEELAMNNVSSVSPIY